MTLAVRTPFGRPVAWAEVSLNGFGDTRTDQSWLVVSGRRLGRAGPTPVDDFVLCLVAEGGAGPARSGEPDLAAGSRASQLAQATWVAAFLGSDEVDVLWRLRDAVRAADARLAAAAEGLAATLTAVCVASDGTAYGVSVGDSPLLVVPPAVRGGIGVKKLGHERATALGAGETLRDGSQAGGAIEQWWPDMEGDGSRTRLAAGTSLVLLSRWPVAGSEAGGDTGRVISVRFDGGQVLASPLVARTGWMGTVVGGQAGREPDGELGLAWLAEDGVHRVVAGMLRRALELDPHEVARCPTAGLAACFTGGGGEMDRTRLAVVATGGAFGPVATLAAGGASVEAATVPDEAGRGFTLRLGSDPLDRGLPIEFSRGVAASAVARGVGAKGGAGGRGWGLGRWWRR